MSVFDTNTCQDDMEPRGLIKMVHWGGQNTWKMTIHYSMSTTGRSRYFCFTLNNPTHDIDDALLEQFGCTYVVFQLERGESGTYHYQGTSYLYPTLIVLI